MAQTEKPRRSTGNVKEPGLGRLPNGQVDLRPTAGYEGNEPVQYSDESDTQFAGRVAQFESSLASAKQIEAGGPTLETSKAALKAKYEADLLSLETQAKEGTLRTK